MFLCLCIFKFLTLPFEYPAKCTLDTAGTIVYWLKLQALATRRCRSLYSSEKSAPSKETAYFALRNRICLLRVKV